jgi:hypothetical protein
VSLFSAVTSEEMQTARVVTGLTMAALLGIGFIPALRQHAALARGVLLAMYLAACAAYVGYVLLRSPN